eukprot:XP_014064194.1 PREDICTED: neuron navigator 3-like isoform X5 [Salmo salar]
MVAHAEIRVVHRGGSKINFREPVITNDSRFLLCASGESVKVYSSSSEECVHDLQGHTDLVSGIVRNPSNHLQVYSCSVDGTVRLWDFTDGILIKTFIIGYPIYSIYVSENHGGVVFVVVPMANDKSSELFQLVAVHLPRSGDQEVEARELSAVLCDVSPSGAASFGRGGEYIAAAKGLQLEVFFFKKQKSYRFFLKSGNKKGAKNAFTCVSCHPKEDCIATGHEDGKIRLWRNFNQKKEYTYSTLHWHHGAVNTLQFTPEGTNLLSGGIESVLVQWRYTQENQKDFLPRLGGAITHIAVSPDGSLFCTSHSDNKITIIQSCVKVSAIIQGLVKGEGVRTDLMIDPRSKALVLNGKPGHLQFYSLHRDKLLYNLDIVQQEYIHEEGLDQFEVVKAAFDTRGDWLATVEERTQKGSELEINLKLWAYNEQTQSFVLNTTVTAPHEDQITAMCFSPSPETTMLVTISFDGHFKAWLLADHSDTKEGASWSCDFVGGYHLLKPGCCCFSADGSLLAVGFQEVVTVWSPSWELLTTLSQPPGAMGGNGAVQLPQQQQHNHPNTATVAPFMYRTYSENDCTTVAPTDHCLSPTKGDLVYSKTAKQCLEEISGEDPETRRMRTVKNIADLRQNLEETMSSLRGTQISHSTLETTFDSTVTTEVNGRSITSRSAPMTSWRLGQSAPSPRLQAGDAPSMPSTYTTGPPPRTGASTGGATGRYGHSDSSRFVYSAPLRRAATAGARGAEQGEKGGGPEGMLEMDVAGYMSDGDILGKNVKTDDITSGYLTDGGLHLYSRNVGRAPDLNTSLEVTQRVVKEVHGDADSWDDSSSVSSGLSDTVDNISTDDLNTPTYPAVTSSPRKNKAAQADTHQHVEQEVSSSWAGAEDLKKVDEELDVSMEPGSKWKPSSSYSASSPAGQCGEDPGQKTGLPMSQTGSWRRGMTAQVGITPPRTKGTSATLKTPGKTDDAKASEKCKAPSKTAGIQRSPSDAGKSSGDEGKKPPSGIARPPTTGSFGYKKMASPPSGALITSSGATLASGSATLGKVPKSSAYGKGTGISGGRKTSLDGSQPQDDGVLMGCGGSKVPLQYRSLPRPAKSSSGGVVGRSGHRSSSSSIDSNVSGKSAGGTGTKRRDAGKVGSGRSSPIPITINQTDKEKVAVSDQDPAGLSTSPKSSPTSTGQSGLRQPGSKYPDIASPTFRRLFGTKASSKASTPGTPDSGKCPSALGSPHGTLARQASLDSPSSGTGSLGSAGGQSGASSPLYGKAPDLGTDSPASSPASGLSLPSNARPWPTNLSSSSACSGSKDTLSCQSMTSLHTSSESIDLLLGHHHGPKVTRTASVKSTLSEGYPPSSRQTSHEEGKEWLRSHSTGGLQDTGSQSPLSPPGVACTSTGKYHYSNLLSPTNLSPYNLPGPSSMSRSNSIPAQDSFDLYGEAHLGGSATSLEDRPRGMSRSGSFRDSTDEVHGSSLSLVSSTSSLYSAVLSFLAKTEEKAHSEGQTGQNTTQIRKLRRELDASQEKVATLTSQLSANAHLVAAFEKSLGNMTCRLTSLTMTAEQKESELAELRETIEALKAQNTDAQTAIQVALNGPDHLHKDLRIRRQHSSESMSSINSAASHSSLGSAKDLEDKKKKKKSWGKERGNKVADSIPAQLRSSFKQAFSKKKGNKPQSPHDDIEEMTDSSLPSSPKLQHANRQDSFPTLLSSASTTDNKCVCDSKPLPIWKSKRRLNGHVVYKHRSRLCECTEAEAEIILQLKNELREKELKLTDIRLEALSSAHHLDQIREAMNRMQVRNQNEIELLKAENDRLKTGGTTPAATPAKMGRPPSETSSTSSSSSRQSLGLSLNNLNITDTIMSDILLDDGYEGNLRKEGRSVRIVVTINSGSNKTKGMQSQEYLIGSIGVSGKTKWDVLDGVIRRLFKEYVFRVDPLTSLGLNSDSIVSYRMGDVVRAHASELPEMLPCGYLVGDNNIISVNLKGVKENSIDSLVFDTLIPKPIIQRYLNLLMEHRRIILSGPSGTGKSFLASKLAEFIVTKSDRKVTESNLASFNVDQKSSKDLRQYLSSLAEQCNSEESETELPTVVILDNLHHIGSLSDIFNGFLNYKYHKCPYVIGTMNQGVSSSPNLELHHNFRWVLCANHTEPVKGFLGRFLRRKLIETEINRNMRSNDLIKVIDWIPKTWQHLNGFLEAHSSSDVTIGPRLFLSCPMDADGSRVWFTDLWNYSLVPYLLEAVREGLQLYGKRAAWEDPSKWVKDTYPWRSASLQHDSQALLQLRPEDVGYDGYSSSKEGASSKQVSQSDTEGDPLMNMLMRLQEAANYSSAQSCDSDSASHHDDQLDSSLESAL